MDVIFVLLLAISLVGFMRWNWLMWQGRVTRWTTWSELSRVEWWIAVVTLSSFLLNLVMVILMAVFGR